VRKPQDLPIQEKGVRLYLSVRRFFCQNLACVRKTFVEQVPSFLLRYARRTNRMTQRLIEIALSSCGEGGARLSKQERMLTSGDTLLRVLRKLGCPQYPTPEALGIDDWAWRKGIRYGTILVDLVRHVVVDLLPDREADTVVAWLKAHHGVKIIARDRASGYAKAASEGAPDAIQVADRWHLLENLAEAVEQVLGQHRGALAIKTETTQSDPGEVRPTPEQETAPSANKRSLAQLRSQEKRRQLYEQTLALYDRGEDKPTIARLLGISITTISKYLSADQFPERQAQPVGSKALRPFTAYLDRRFAEGCHVAKQLWREICAQGYDRSPRAVFTYVSHLRQGLPTYSAEKATPKTSVRRLTPWEAAHLWMTFPDDLKPNQRQDLATLRQAHADFEQAYQLAQTFIKMVHNSKPDALNPWIHDALNSTLTPFKTLATGIHRDKAAVLAALSLPWSSGQVEGQINRLKTLKRQMYGRASLDLLRIRVMRPN
jgi:transposase